MNTAARFLNTLVTALRSRAFLLIGALGFAVYVGLVAIHPVVAHRSQAHCDPTALDAEQLRLTFSIGDVSLTAAIEFSCHNGTTV